MIRKYDAALVRNLQEVFALQLRAHRARGTSQMALAAMAHALQAELANMFNGNDEVPHCGPLATIMRAVAADITGDRSEHVSQKLTIGTTSLLRDLAEHGYVFDIVKKRM